MFRFMLARKLAKNWHRWFGTRRERTPTTLQECLDHQPPRRGLWRNWFIVLIILPALYYFILMGRSNGRDEYSITVQRERRPSGPRLVRPNFGQEISRHSERKFIKEIKQNNQEILSSKSHLRPEPIKAKISKTSYYQMERRPQLKPMYFVDTHQHPKESKTVYSIDNGTLIRTMDPKNSIFVRIPARHEKISVTTAGPVARRFMLMCVPRIKIRKGFTAVKPRNLTDDIAYRQELYKGGFHSPGNCQPRHKVAILVPYRNRATNLAVFLYNIHPFLIDQALEYRIFVIEQSGDELFNKGRLYNAGFVEALKYGDWGCFVFHDVDLLPTNQNILYTCPTYPRHMSATVLGITDPTYRSLFGGVTAMTASHFKAVNGYSNLYFGWGGEDTDMFWRLKAAGLPIVRYSKNVAKYLPLPHDKEPENPIRKQLSNNAMDRYKTDGLSTLKYRLVSVTLYQTYTHLLVDINSEHDNITELQIKWMDG